MRSIFTTRFFLVPVLLGASLLSQSQASLLVYEGFAGYSGNLGAVTPNSNTIGLNQGVAYQGGGVANFTVNASSLSFGSNFLTSGGSVTTTNGTSVAAATLSLASPYVGTLYGSYLVQLSNKASGAGDGALARISSNNANSGERFISFADSRSSSTNIGASYDAAGPAVGTTGLVTGTTYLMLSRFTNVGSSIGVGGGAATVYALTLAQYESFLAAGATQSYLDNTAVGLGSAQITGRVSDTNNNSGTYTLATGGFAQFVSVGDVAQFDEMRYGTSLADVAPVPEPSTFALAAVALGALYVLRRRSRS